jgi:uncharacterized protein (TIGR04222 family)
LTRALRTAFLGLCLLPLSAGAQERILSFHSDIVVARDGSMAVTETIRVRAEGNQIRRGIFRDFPTDYRDRLGNRYRVDFSMLDAERDGSPDAFRIERIGNGVRVYLGRADYFLPVGEYEYRLRYRTDRQLGFFADHDELYWNATGNGWDFEIVQASASVEIPAGLGDGELGIEAYVGRTGSTEQSYDAELTSERTATVRSLRALAPREGLTLVATWPKGLIAAPTASERAVYVLRDNRALLAALVGFAVIFVYLFSVWSVAGRDPRPGVIFPHYAPPEQLSPASVRYLLKMGYDTKAFTAAVISLAVKGYLTIAESGGQYTLKRRPEGVEPLAPGERVVVDALFSGGDELVLEDGNHATMLQAMDAHGKSLKRDYYRSYFVRNSGLALPAPFALAITGAVVVLPGDATPLSVALLGASLIVIVVFFFLMKAPTRLGRRALDQIEGFKQYLELAEKDELNLRNPPEKTPALFEKFLPYALALSVEQAWSEKFATAFERLKATTGQAYQPAWYFGAWDASHVGRSMTSLTTMTTSLDTAISSSATPPGSSSGSGGGGSSGGGGGGGGGGGW